MSGLIENKKQDSNKNDTKLSFALQQLKLNTQEDGMIKGRVFVMQF